MRRAFSTTLQKTRVFRVSLGLTVPAALFCFIPPLSSIKCPVVSHKIEHLLDGRIEKSKSKTLSVVSQGMREEELIFPFPLPEQKHERKQANCFPTSLCLELLHENTQTFLSSWRTKPNKDFMSAGSVFRVQGEDKGCAFGLRYQLRILLQWELRGKKCRFPQTPFLLRDIKTGPQDVCAHLRYVDRGAKFEIKRKNCISHNPEKKRKMKRSQIQMALWHDTWNEKWRCANGEQLFVRCAKIYGHLSCSSSCSLTINLAHVEQETHMRLMDVRS